MKAPAGTKKPSADRQEPALPLYGIGLGDVYLIEAHVERREHTEGFETPAYEFALDIVDSDEDVAMFHANLGVAVTFRFRTAAVCKIRTVTTGRFHVRGPVPETDLMQFKNADCAILLWPYARAYVGELARMSGLTLPPLPPLDVRAALKQFREASEP